MAIIQNDKGIINTKQPSVNIVRPSARRFKSDDSFGYIKTDGKMNIVKAPSAPAAIDTAPNRAPTSGVMKLQQSTTSERADTARRMSDLNERQQRRLRNQQKMAEAQANQPKKEEEDVSVVDTEKDGTAARVKEIERKANDQVAQITRQLDSISASMDDASNDLIAALRQTYGARISKMKDANKRLLATKEQIGMRSTGLARYAPGLQAGVLADEEIAGHERIAELEGELLQAVAKASQAKAENRLKIFNQQYDRVETIFSSMQQEIQNLHKTAIEKDKEIRAQEKAELDAERIQFENQTKKSKAVAVAVASKLEGYKTEEEKNAFLEKYADTIGVDVDVLLSEVESASMDRAKKQLEIKDKQSLINNRGTKTTTQKQKSFGTAADQSKVKRYIASNPESTDEDMRLAETDEGYFYFLLNIAEQEGF